MSRYRIERKTLSEQVAEQLEAEILEGLRIPANVTGHYGDRDRFAHGLHAGESFVR